MSVLSKDPEWKSVRSLEVVEGLRDLSIDYHDDTHSYFVDGTLRPSINQVADELLGKVTGIDPYYAERGTAVHTVCEMLQRDPTRNLDEMNLDEDIVGFCVAFQNFLDDTKWVSLAIEEPVYSPKLQIIGRPDTIGYFSDKPITVLDIKTGSHYPRYDFCSAGYAQLASEYYGVEIEERAYLHLRQDEGYEVRYARRKSDRAAFVGYATARLWKAAFGGKK